MASTAVIDPAAGATAGAASASPTPSPAGGNGADSGALLTDDSILGIETDSGAPTTSTVEPTSTTDQPAAPSAAPQELTVNDFNTLFKDNPKVQSLWDQFDRLRSVSGRLGTPTQIGKLADSLDLIGGVDQLSELVNDHAEEEQAYASLAAGSPESRKTLLENYAQWWGNQAFADVSRIGLDVLKTKAPEEFQALTSQFFMDGIKNEGLYGWAARLQEARSKGADMGELADELIGWMYQKFHGNQGQGQSLEAKRIENERLKLTQEQQSWNQRVQQESFERVSTSVRSTVNTEIGTLLDSLKVNGRQVFGENSARAKAMISQQIYDRSFEKVNANPILVARLKSMESARGSEKDTIDLLTKAYRTVLRSVAEEVVGEWTNGFVGQQKAQLERARASASRPDAGSSVSRGEKTSGKLTSRELEKAGGYKKLSDDDILNL